MNPVSSNAYCEKERRFPLYNSDLYLISETEVILVWFAVFVAEQVAKLQFASLYNQWDKGGWEDKIFTQLEGKEGEDLPRRNMLRNH